MKRTTLFLTSILTAGSLALPLAAQASGAQGQYGLIDYKMKIAQPAASEMPMEEPVVAIDPGTKSTSLNQYGLVDLKMGDAPTVVASDDSGALPVDSQLKKATGIAENATDARIKGAVVSSDGAAVGTIDRVVAGATSDTVYIRVSDNIKDRTFSLFRVDVPKGAIHHGELKLGWTLSDLMDHLRAEA